MIFQWFSLKKEGLLEHCWVLKPSDGSKRRRSQLSTETGARPILLQLLALFSRLLERAGARSQLLACSNVRLWDARPAVSTFVLCWQFAQFDEMAEKDNEIVKKIVKPEAYKWLEIVRTENKSSLLIANIEMCWKVGETRSNSNFSLWKFLPWNCPYLSTLTR